MSNEIRPITVDWNALVTAATAARENAWAPFSKFKVGAALLTSDGTIYSGCNVENRTFGLTICAERNAVTTAVADGRRDFVAVVVVTDASPPAPPCGMCRETLVEFASELEILSANLEGERRHYRLSEIFPEPFDGP
ncbi:MAG: cytidine deaminase [Thermoanaerobaculia bacterium]|nr:cytidine deaminase [Thermoanaerobaculia bacterium]